MHTKSQNHVIQLLLKKTLRNERRDTERFRLLRHFQGTKE